MDILDRGGVRRDRVPAAPPLRLRVAPRAVGTPRALRPAVEGPFDNGAADRRDRRADDVDRVRLPRRRRRRRARGLSRDAEEGQPGGALDLRASGDTFRYASMRKDRNTMKG